MKKCLFIVAMLFTMTSFAAPWDIEIPKQKRFWPWVDLIQVYKFQGGNLMLSIKLSESWPEDLYITVPVHTRLKTSYIPEVWQWVWIHYNVRVPHDMKSLAHILSTNMTYQYNSTPYGDDGTMMLDGPEYYVEYFGY